MEETTPSAPSLHPNINSFSEQYVNDKILANNKFKNNINIRKDGRNYYETETKNYNKKFSRHNKFIKIER